ncbi:OmpA family protein [bacterium endosymbiont of Bathymodiolus sp. 5 South]|jgi:peptidoglycan-associated lipoprotein|uniref:OmpA family protein n=1 Tax=bacterium endosymbiont of Bathymodiolus sp. 5 South TaxID=1181670 RepID=UPI0010B64F8D|nr:OmpA family protein [bacterium endosymbiont of Bathymodiolus sp. 5 South]CAC9440177.1 Tol-Pal system peptidoglycan-associated lipoprotein PAL [uncultured Gammaproteobacteria bacterium]CAC9658968.1 Tol-Pal system peptidoglycan-associated lipoprotein PAL [uncultured Gammaproteobacteria bacterium]SHN89844.1 Tol-Pal system peptidoglycan-associated lipoprotein PAL [bacterium endosymbiont of Bathymodiolus sp. 5 South]SSC08181.1 18K peptidoglycan-associated outer membrane lipoprotein; Peptidoglycan
MKTKIIVILPLIAILSACSTTDNLDTNTVIIEDRGTGEVDAIAYGQETFEWKGGEQVANIDAMPTKERESVVAALKANGGKLVLYFDYDTADISSQANQEIMKHIAFMQDNPKIRLRLEGHADERGTREYNLALGENRALSVKQLLGFGDRIEVVSYGEEKPQSSENDKNRRVEFIYK